MGILSEIGNAIMGIFQAIWDFLKAVGRVIKNIFLKLANVIGFFKDPSRLNELKRNRQALAVSIKENLNNGRFNVVNCLYDRGAEQVIDMETDSVGYEDSAMDNQLSSSFGSNDMLVLQ